jgi:hypothetical protein
VANKVKSMGFERILRRILEYGVLAPSIYNSQPWKFSIDSQKGFIEVYPDEARARPRGLDPKQRDLYLALGSCVEYMVLAAPALGYELKEDLFPGKGLAVRLALKALPEAIPESLFSSMLVRQTHSGKYREASVEEIHLDRLRALPSFSSQEKIYFVIEKRDRQDLFRFLHEVSHEGALQSALIGEGARWVRPGDAEDGLPLGHLGLPISVKFRFAFLHYLFYQREIEEVARQTLLRQGHGIEAPAFLMMTTSNPGPPGYFNAGRWHARLALTLSEIEMASQTLHLPVTLNSTHDRLREIFEAGPLEEPVLLLRFGQPEKKNWPRTFRRAVEESFQK